MAKRKRTAKRSTRRRSRISGVSPSLMNAVYAIAGGALARVASGVVGKALPPSTSDSTANLVKAGTPLVLGFFLPKFIKSDTGKFIGLGMMTMGGVSLVQSFGVLNGIAGIDFYDRPMLAGANMANRLPEPGSNYTTPMLAGMVS